MDDIKSLVIEEARNLKKFATQREKDKLNSSLLRHWSPSACIYGQLTGDCHSARATALIRFSCTHVYGSGKGIDLPNPLRPLANLSRDSFWSPIEVFIASKEEKITIYIKRIIDYIQGRTEILILD